MIVIMNNQLVYLLDAYKLFILFIPIKAKHSVILFQNIV